MSLCGDLGELVAGPGVAGLGPGEFVQCVRRVCVEWPDLGLG